MSLLKLSITTFIFFSDYVYAQSELDNYYTLEREVEKLKAEFRDGQRLVSKYNKTYKHIWTPTSTKKILDRTQKKLDRILNKIEPKVKEMRRLEQSIEVKAWSSQFGKLQQVNARLSDVSSNYTCSTEGRQLFTGNRAFELWNAQNGDLDRKIDYYARKNKRISHCLAKNEEGSKASVSEKSRSLCKKVKWAKDIYYGNNRAYQLKKENGKIVLSAKLYFSFKGEERYRDEAFKLMQDTRPCMANFFAKHGIKLDVTFHEETGFIDRWTCDHSLNLHTNHDRANALNWVSHNTVGVNLDSHTRCAVALHEFGHLLGLPDTYPDPDCPDRETIMPRDDIMHGSWSGPGLTTFYPDAIKKILEPLCGE